MMSMENKDIVYDVAENSEGKYRIKQHGQKSKFSTVHYSVQKKNMCRMWKERRNRYTDIEMIQ